MQEDNPYAAPGGQISPDQAQPPPPRFLPKLTALSQALTEKAARYDAWAGEDGRNADHRHSRREAKIHQSRHQQKADGFRAAQKLLDAFRQSAAAPGAVLLPLMETFGKELAALPPEPPMKEFRSHEGRNEILHALHDMPELYPVREVFRQEQQRLLDAQNLPGQDNRLGCANPLGLLSLLLPGGGRSRG